MSDTYGLRALWRFVAVLACVGALAIVAGAVAGVVWIATHLRWAP